ncbi:unnamed protein product [Boreogadus saida]
MEITGALSPSVPSEAALRVATLHQEVHVRRRRPAPAARSMDVATLQTLGPHLTDIAQICSRVFPTAGEFHGSMV